MAQVKNNQSRSSLRHFLSVIVISVTLSSAAISFIKPLRNLYSEYDQHARDVEQADISLQVFDEISDKHDNDQLLKLVEKVSLQYPTDSRVSAELYHLRVMQILEKDISFSDRYNYGKHFELSPLIAEGYWLIEQLTGDPRQVKVLNDVALLLYFEPADTRQEAFQSLMNRTLELEPDNTIALFYQAHWYQREKEMDKAIPLFLKAGNGPPVFSPALVEVAYWYEKNNKYEAAIEILKNAVPACRTMGNEFFWRSCRSAERFLKRMHIKLLDSQPDEAQDE